ncbi:TylF/MycF/NovP-related O-methyltransferase [Microcoleus sp. BROC3]|uniref:TylF/MycF/NovP-related O-methyltransferase n=1 Tax=Microcoleus sp. BROC3 TaxID=3055323 RepID=UPI002FD39742
MGIGVTTLYLYHHLRQNSYFNNFKSVIELGSQDIYSQQEQFAQLLDKLFAYSLPDGSPMTAKTLYQSMGLELYQCIDADGRHNALTFDLNKDIKQAYGFAEQFDLVTNHGTTEHCFDQYRCFMNIHNLCAVGGLMIHVLPIQGYVNHGLYNYQPSFFYNLAAANHYKVINVYLSSYKSCDSLPYILPGLISYTENALKTLCNIGDAKADMGLYVVLQKTIESSFSIPYDGQYLKVSLLQNEYSYQSGATANAPPLKEESTEDSQEKLDSKIVEATPLIENLIEKESDQLPTTQFQELDKFPEQHLEASSQQPEEVDIQNITDLWNDETKKALALGVMYVCGADVEGDIAEFGTKAGKTSKIIASAISNIAKLYPYIDSAKRKKLHLFDSFQGLPKSVSPIDQESPHVIGGTWGSGACKGGSKQQLLDICKDYLTENRILIYEGWFKDTLDRIPADTKFSMLHIDCDLYLSALEVLEACFAKGFVQEGTAIFFDDWNCNRGSPVWGERRAWSEIVEKFIVKFSDEGSYSWHGKKFIVHSYKIDESQINEKS